MYTFRLTDSAALPLIKITIEFQGCHLLNEDEIINIATYQNQSQNCLNRHL
jgi:hypothetical protein